MAIFHVFITPIFSVTLVIKVRDQKYTHTYTYIYIHTHTHTHIYIEVQNLRPYPDLRNQTVF